jgi:DNA mismatch endonuclease (patch repair protein)
MSRIRGEDTRPERIVRSALHQLGFRFQLKSGRRLPGRPDVVLRKHRVVVFVHGCFWHRHRGCRLAYTPKSNLAHWRGRFRENVTRDRRVLRELRRLGWRPVVIWECQTSPVSRLTSKLRRVVIRRA